MMCLAKYHFRSVTSDKCDAEAGFFVTLMSFAAILYRSGVGGSKVTMSVCKRKKNSKPQREYETKTRKCLMCRDEFTSRHPGERICVSCKGTAAWREGLAL